MLEHSIKSLCLEDLFLIHFTRNWECNAKSEEFTRESLYPVWGTALDRTWKTALDVPRDMLLYRKELYQLNFLIYCGKSTEEEEWGHLWYLRIWQCPQTSAITPDIGPFLHDRAGIGVLITEDLRRVRWSRVCIELHATIPWWWVVIILTLFHLQHCGCLFCFGFTLSSFFFLLVFFSLATPFLFLFLFFLVFLSITWGNSTHLRF